MGLLENARELWTVIRNETAKRANTAQRVGNAGLAILDVIEALPMAEDGRGITSITRTSGTGAAGTTDTYTIIFTDDTTTTFTVVNGANGTTTETLGYALSDQTSDITTGVKLTDRMPYAFTLTDIRGSLQTAASGGTFTVNIKKNGASIFSTKLTFDSGEASTATALVPFVLSSNSFAADDIIEFSVDAVGSVVAGKGLIVKLIGNK